MIGVAAAVTIVFIRLIKRSQQITANARLTIYSVIAVIAAMILLIIAFGGANAADALKDGRAVRRFEFTGRRNGITLLAIHAEPVTIRAIGNPDDTAAIKTLEHRELFYLGQSNGMAVLYESGNAQRVVYVPVSTTLMSISNCDMSVDSRCENAWDHLEYWIGPFRLS